MLFYNSTPDVNVPKALLEWVNENEGKTIGEILTESSSVFLEAMASSDLKTNKHYSGAKKSLETIHKNADVAYKEATGKDFGKVRAKAEAEGKKLGNEIKGTVISAAGLKAIGRAIGKSFTDLWTEFELKDVPEHIVWVIIISLLNSLGFVIMAVVTGGNGPLAMYLTATIVAPIVEEFGKREAKKRGQSGTHFVVFNVFEFGSYVIQYFSVVGPAIFGIRVLAASMHGINTVLHNLGFNLDKEIGEITKKKHKANIVTYVLAVIVHGLWNGVLRSIIMKAVFGK